MTNDAVALLVRLLEIESTTGREARVARFLATAMAAHGFDAHIDEAGNAVGVREGPTSAGPWRDIVLLGHLDTVPGRINVRLDGDVLTGRGAVDAKGPLAAFAIAASRATLEPGTRVIVIGAVEEEGSSRGARHVATQYRPDTCVIGEPSGWDAITLGYKGSLRVEYRHERLAGHSAGPDGAVAEDALDWWQSTRVHVAALNRERKSTIFERVQSRLGGINTATDGLVDSVVATASFRLPPELDGLALFEAARESASAGHVRLLGHEPAFRTTRSNPLARPFVAAIRAVGGEPRFKLKTGTSDMNVVGPAWGCPIVAYGPGDSALDHSPDEHVRISEYLRSIDVLTDAIGEISRGDSRPLGGDRDTGEIRDHRFHAARR